MLFIRVQNNVPRVMESIRHARAYARTQAAIGIAAAALRFLVATAPRDTNRYANGWAQAAAALGVLDTPVRPLRESRYGAHYRKRLERQDRHIASLLRHWYGSEDAVTKPGRAEDKTFRRLIAARAVTRQQLAEYVPTAIVMGSRLAKGRTAGIGNLRTQLSRVYPAPYGGGAIVIEGPALTQVRFFNREPHARVVATRSGQAATVRRVLAGRNTAPTTAVRRVGLRYLGSLAAAAERGQGPPA